MVYCKSSPVIPQRGPVQLGRTEFKRTKELYLVNFASPKQLDPPRADPMSRLSTAFMRACKLQSFSTNFAKLFRRLPLLGSAGSQLCPVSLLLKDAWKVWQGSKLICVKLLIIHDNHHWQTYRFKSQSWKRYLTQSDVLSTGVSVWIPNIQLTFGFLERF